MRHRKTYVYINFQQNRVNRSVKTMHANLFANKTRIFFQIKVRFSNSARMNKSNFATEKIM